MTRKKTYSELMHISSLEDRVHYLKLTGKVGEETFGRARPLNQAFYQSQRWKKVRAEVILRDNGCNVGIPGQELQFAIVHHINPITDEDIEMDADCLYDPENLITVSKGVHEAIHYGDKRRIDTEFQAERKPNDTCPWKM